MNIVKSSNNFFIYESIETFDKLPVNTYNLNFNKQSGFYLSIAPTRPTLNKIYGSTPNRITKTLKAFERSNHNIGILAAGVKGSGKTIFARELIERANLPTILVNSCFPGMNDFLTSIDQECLIIFDEFEKTFKEDPEDNIHMQESLLTLVDGVTRGKKLFVFIANRYDGISEFFLNRPGRILYSFSFEPLNPNEIKEICADTLNQYNTATVDFIVRNSYLTNLTYDSLAAIINELNFGYSIEETFRDLNIVKENDVAWMNARIVLSNGATYTTNSRRVWLQDLNDIASFYLFLTPDSFDVDSKADYVIQFKSSNIFFDESAQCLSVPLDKIAVKNLKDNESSISIAHVYLENEDSFSRNKIKMDA